MPVLSDFRIVDNFYLWEAYQGINNGHTIDEFRIVDNYYLYIEILTFSPSAELWIPGTGLESARLKNTALPNDASGDHSVAAGTNNTASGLSSDAWNNGNIVSGIESSVKGNANIVNANRATAEGIGNIINVGADISHVEGNANIIDAIRAHVEGSLNQATVTADDAHIEGQGNIVSGPQAHAQNFGNVASNDNTHAGGRQVIASGSGSFNHSAASNPGDSDAMADECAILGGRNNNVDINSPRSVALGGSSNNIVAEPDTAQAQNARITADLRITQGANKNSGTSAALVAGTLVVANTVVKTGAIILLSHKTLAGVPGVLSNPTIINATSFTITSSNAGDTSTVNFLIINP